jgi:hypothetical protein
MPQTKTMVAVFETTIGSGEGVGEGAVVVSAAVVDAPAVAASTIPDTRTVKEEDVEVVAVVERVSVNTPNMDATSVTATALATFVVVRPAVPSRVAAIVIPAIEATTDVVASIVADE